MSLEEVENLGGFVDVMSELPPELQADATERATIAGYARKLRGENEVRRAASTILAGIIAPAEAGPALRAAVMDRSGFRWRERIVAAWCLGLSHIPEERRGYVLEALGTLANHNLEKDNGGAFLRLQWRALFLTLPFLLITSGPVGMISELSPAVILQT